MHVKESKYRLLIKGRKKQLKNPKAFIDSSQTIDDVHENLEDYNPTNETKVLIVFDNVITDMESNKKFKS